MYTHCVMYSYALLYIHILMLDYIMDCIFTYLYDYPTWRSLHQELLQRLPIDWKLRLQNEDLRRDCTHWQYIQWAEPRGTLFGLGQ